MTKDRLLLLINAYLEDQIQEEDYQELVDYIHYHYGDRALREVINEVIQDQAWRADIPVPGEEIFQKIVQDSRYRAHRRSRFFMTNRVKKISAAVLAVAATVVLILFLGKHQHQLEPIIPGGKKALLTLANGAVISLDSSSSEAVAIQGNTRLRLNKGKLLYDALEGARESPTDLENMITTPAGSEYQAVLPDGTRIWLNASSSIRYPVRFGDKERRVMITGEVYFEVKEDKAQPFIVAAKNTEVQVLGTSFNVAAYSDEAAINTTLVEGQIQVQAGDNKRLLLPGQQAIIDDEKGAIALHSVDTDEILAWKNGYFSFNHEPLESVMKKISRWYDVEVVYSGDLSGKKLDGSISRMENIHQLLMALEMTKTAHFRVEGRRIIVMN